MALHAFAFSLLLAATAPSGCPEPYGEQHRHVACYQAALADAEARGDLSAQARALMQLAWAAWQTTELEKCRDYFERAIDAHHKTGDAAAEARAANFFGLFLQTQLGDREGAEARYLNALEIAKRVRDRRLEGEALYHLSWLATIRHDFQGTIRYGEQSLEARRASGDSRGEGLTLAMMGMAYMATGKYAESIRYQEEALPLIHESGDRRAEADVLDHIGHALVLLQRYEQAIPYHSRAIELRGQVSDNFDGTLSLSNLADAYRGAGRLREAAESMQCVIEAVERARETQSTRQYRTAVFARKLRHYESYIDLLMEMRDDAAALHISERARARLTLDAIDQARASGGALEGRLDEVRPLTASEIQQQLLDDETMLVEYSLGEERSFVWWVTRHDVFSRAIGNRRTLEAAAQRLHQLLSAGDQRLRRRELAEAIDTMSSLALDPVVVPKNVRRIVFVADGALQYVPFSALHLKKSTSPLIERYEIVTAPSASTMVAMRKLQAGRSAGRDAIAVLADPVFDPEDERVAAGRRNGVRPATYRGGDLARLPYTRQEAAAILRFAPRGSVGALDFDARRDVVLSGDLTRFDVLHFATHAIVDGDHAGIVLSQVDIHGNRIDGVVRLQDLYRIRLEASLVVLSACRTALGRELRGEGMVGLVRGFMHAGAPRVVATYWDVKDESTSDLMRRFYRGMLVERQSPAAALRSAQLAMRRDRERSAPYYWAAFTLQGDWR
jgi:CHAT domain-containing protein